MNRRGLVSAGFAAALSLRASVALALPIIQGGEAVPMKLQRAAGL
jgi:hypothetical protein